MLSQKKGRSEMRDKKCDCEGCKHTPHLTTLAAKATPEEKAALDWIYADMEDISVEAALAEQRHEQQLSEKDRRIKQLETFGKQLRARVEKLEEALARVPRMLNESEVLEEYEAEERNTSSRKKMRAMLDGFRAEVIAILSPQPPADPGKETKHD